MNRIVDRIVDRIVASAPGKLLLAGEYAVLDGAPAICMAVNRRAVVTVEVGGRDIESDLHIVRAPSYAQVPGRFRERGGSLEWTAGGQPYALFERVWLTAMPSTDEMLDIVLDTRTFRDDLGGRKFGLGSSAALTTALATALCAMGAVVRDVAKVSSRAHRRFQGGVGSGADIACSLAGGIIEYRMGELSSTKLEWPSGLHSAVLWSGVSADTGARVMRMQRQDERSSKLALTRAAESAAIAWRGSVVADILDEFRKYVSALMAFSDAHDLGVFDAGHAALVDLADRFGVVYKPCGAGGGDVGIVLGSEEPKVASFVACAIDRGFRVIDLQVDAEGARLDTKLQ